MIRPGKIYCGTTVTLSVAFQSDNGAAQAVTAVTFKTHDPYGQAVTYTYGTDTEIELIDTGMYKATIRPTTPGRWFTRWEADDEIAVEDNFIVQDSPFYTGNARDYL